MIIGKTRTNQPVEGDGNAIALELTGKDIAPKDINSSGSITGNSIIENMSGYSASISGSRGTGLTLNVDYCGVVKNGNKLTLALAGSITRTTGGATASLIVDFGIPSAIGTKLYPMSISGVDGLSFKELYLASAYNSGVKITTRLNKTSNTNIGLEFYNMSNMVEETEYIFRFEETFLLSDSLITGE